MKHDTRSLQPSSMERMKTFCEAFSVSGSVTKGAAVAGVSRATVRNWEREDRDGFRQLLRDAQAAYSDKLESMALERVEHPEGNRGSDTLLIALNNANNPDEWRGNSMTVEVPDVVVQVLTELQVQAQAIKSQLPAADVVDGVTGAAALPWD